MYRKIIHQGKLIHKKNTSNNHSISNALLKTLMSAYHDENLLIENQTIIPPATTVNKNKTEK